MHSKEKYSKEEYEKTARDAKDARAEIQWSGDMSGPDLEARKYFSETAQELDEKLEKLRALAEEEAHKVNDEYEEQKQYKEALEELVVELAETSKQLRKFESEQLGMHEEEGESQE